MFCHICRKYLFRKKIFHHENCSSLCFKLSFYHRAFRLVLDDQVPVDIHCYHLLCDVWFYFLGYRCCCYGTYFWCEIFQWWSYKCRHLVRTRHVRAETMVATRGGQWTIKFLGQRSKIIFLVGGGGVVLLTGASYLYLPVPVMNSDWLYFRILNHYCGGIEHVFHRDQACFDVDFNVTIYKDVYGYID